MSEQADISRSLRIKMIAAALLVVAIGATPWLTSGPLVIRIMAVPVIIVAALFALAVARYRAAPVPAYLKSQGGCAGCDCQCQSSNP